MSIPFVKRFKPLSPDTEKALRASIERSGVLIPIAVDQDGVLLDGDHRKRICEDLGLDCPRSVIFCESDEKRAEVSRTLNVDRRQLTEKQRKAEAFALRTQGHSYRAIGAALGTSEATVRRDVSSASDDAVDLPATVTGLDGKQRQAVTTARRNKEDHKEEGEVGLAPPTMHRGQKNQQRTEAIRAELGKLDGATFRVIAARVGCHEQTVSGVAHDMGINGKTRSHTRADGRIQDVASSVIERISAATGQVKGTTNGVLAVLEKYGDIPTVRAALTTLAYEMAEGAKEIKMAIRKKEK